jgi:hypothetical protein
MSQIFEKVEVVDDFLNFFFDFRQFEVALHGIDYQLFDRWMVTEESLPIFEFQEYVEGLDVQAFQSIKFDISDKFSLGIFHIKILELFQINGS